MRRFKHLNGNRLYLSSVMTFSTERYQDILYAPLRAAGWSRHLCLRYDPGRTPASAAEIPGFLLKLYQLKNRASQEAGRVHLAQWSLYLRANRLNTRSCAI